MKIKTNTKAGKFIIPVSQHNETILRGLKVKSNVRSGGMNLNHNQALVRGMKVKSNVKSGFFPWRP